MRINDEIMIDEKEFEERFIRASGPGGQNVNKVETAVQLRFRLGANQTLPAHAKARLRRLAGSRLTSEGDILIEAKTHRAQGANRDEARRRLADLIRRSLIRPKPRIATKPSRGAVERRLQEKKKRGLLKRGRSQGAPDE